MIPVRNLDAIRRDFIERTGLGTDAYQITPRSPWPSELFALHALGVEHGVRTWLEGGTYHGQAAEVLARANPDARIVTVELFPEIAAVAIERLAHLAPRVEVIVGNAHDHLPPLADSLPGPIGVFLDGPKGFDAFMCAYHLLASRPSVAFVAMHDMPQSAPGRAVPARAAIDELGRYEPQNWRSWATDDPEYVAWAKGLDDGTHERHTTESAFSGWRPHEHFAEGQPTIRTRSYGPTVAVLMRGA